MGNESKGLAKALEMRAYKASDTDETKLKKDLLWVDEYWCCRVAGYLLGNGHQVLYNSTFVLSGYFCCVSCYFSYNP